MVIQVAQHAHYHWDNITDHPFVYGHAEQLEPGKDLVMHTNDDLTNL